MGILKKATFPLPKKKWEFLTWVFLMVILGFGFPLNGSQVVSKDEQKPQGKVS